MDLDAGRELHRVEIRQHHRNGGFPLKLVDEGILEPVAQCVLHIVRLVRKTETEQRPKSHVHVPVLKHLVIEILLREIRIQRQQRTVFLGRIRKRGQPLPCLGPILADFTVRRIVILLGLGLHSEHVLHVGTVHIGLREIRIEFDGPVIVLLGIEPSGHVHEI